MSYRQEILFFFLGGGLLTFLTRIVVTVQERMHLLVACFEFLRNLINVNDAVFRFTRVRGRVSAVQE